MLWYVSFSAPCGMVVTSYEAVKDAQSGNESTNMIKEVLVSGQTQDTKQCASIEPGFYNVRCKLNRNILVLVDKSQPFTE